MASVHKHGPTWSVRWREGGKHHRVSGLSEEEARAIRPIKEAAEARSQRSGAVDRVVRAEIARLEKELARLRAFLDTNG